MNYTSPLRRFLFRKDLCKRIQARLALCRRRMAKNELSDLGTLFGADHPKVIFDVGANVGFLTWQVAKLFPTALIYAFEPDPVPRQVLQRTLGANPRVRVIPLATADKPGQMTLIQRELSCNSSLLPAAGKSGVAGEHRVVVETSTIDLFCAEQAIPHIGLLKTDTEGADLLVLQGAKTMLAEQRVDVVMSEVFFVPIYDGQPTLDELAGFLRSFGFRLFNIYIAREAQNGQAHYANVVFISERLQTHFRAA